MLLLGLISGPRRCCAPARRRAYLVEPGDGLVGVAPRVAPHAGRVRRGMCSSCLTTHTGDGVSLPGILRGALDVARTAHGVLPHRLPVCARKQFPDGYRAVLLAAVITVGLLDAPARPITSRRPGVPLISPRPVRSPTIPACLKPAGLGSNYTCGYLTVPENRDAPNGRTIRILVARVNRRGTLHSDPHLSCPEVDEFTTQAVGLVYLEGTAQITVRNPAGDPVRVIVDGFKLIPVVLDWSTSRTKVIEVPRMIDSLANGDGHCAQTIMTTYLDNPNSSVDCSCIAQTTVPTFTTS